jgi:hypothetical protein
LQRTETFAPVLLKKQAKKLRKETGHNIYFAPQELKSDAAFTLAQTITRPLTMLVFEPIILFTAIYVSLAWSMVFFYFQAYPIIFEGMFSRMSRNEGNKAEAAKEHMVLMSQRLLSHTFQVSLYPSLIKMVGTCLILNSGHRRCIILSLCSILRHDFSESQETREALGLGS